VKGIDFVNRADGWALLDGRGLMSTRDGGRTWSTPVEPSQGPIVTATFTGPKDGWAITDQGQLLRTLDGGRIWHAVPTPVPAETLCATRAGTLWLGSTSGDIYLATEDGPWRLSFSGSDVVSPFPNSVQPSPPPPVPWLACTGDSAWALYQYGESAGSDPFVLERTLNGGAQWGIIPAPEGQSLVPPNPRIVLATPRDFGVSGATRAWVLGYCGPCTTGSSGLVTTTDGTTFSGTLLSAATDIYAWPIDVAFLDPERGWAVLQEQPVYAPGSASVTKVVLLATVDGGATWKVVDPDVPQGR
jgi:photosystem II stability/assembly factor-like uncharacterized protein